MRVLVIVCLALTSILALIGGVLRITEPPELHRVPEIQDPSCKRVYEALYERSSIDVRVVFGYKDTSPARFVGDLYERNAFVHELIAPCSHGEFACGFERSPSDADLFWKRISGPDGSPKTVLVRVVASAVGPDDYENRSTAFQKRQSAHAREIFLDGLRSADVVFYNGHSRDGGGPDFDPPRLNEYKHVDYEKYREKKAGLREMVSVLRESRKSAKGGPKLLGLFSCSSNQWFLGRIREANKKVGVISSRHLLYYSSALESSLEVLSGLIGMKCRPEFKLQAGTEMSGFF